MEKMIIAMMLILLCSACSNADERYLVVQCKEFDKILQVEREFPILIDKNTGKTWRLIDGGWGGIPWTGSGAVSR